MTRTNYKFLLLVLCGLTLITLFRIFTYKGESFPRQRDISFEATITRNLRLTEDYQVVRVADTFIYVPLYPKHNVGDRIMVSGYVDEEGRIFNGTVAKVGERPVFLGFIHRLRDKIEEKLGEIMSGPHETLTLGTVLGIDMISKEFRDALVRTGTIHVVVVSGQNLMIVAGTVMALAKYIGRRQALALSVLAVAYYAVLSGFEPPVIRATIIVALSTIAIYLGRETNALLSLYFAAILILLIWPGSAYEISFQLTFAASLGIITLGQKLIRSFRGVPIIGDICAVAISAFLFTMPIVVYYFGSVSILSPIVNVLVAEAVLPIMLIGFLASLSSLIFLPLAKLLVLISYPASLFFSEAVFFFSSFEIGLLRLGRESLLFVTLYYFLLGALYIIWSQKWTQVQKHS